MHHKQCDLCDVPKKGAKLTSSADFGMGLASIMQLVREASRQVQVCLDVSVSIISCSPSLIYTPLSLHYFSGVDPH